MVLARRAKRVIILLQSYGEVLSALLKHYRPEETLHSKKISYAIYIKLFML